MSVKKRVLDDKTSSSPRKKKVKLAESTDAAPKARKEDVLQVTSNTVSASEEIDFPRGGGSSFTPLEYKIIRAEALKEVNDELVFKDNVSKKVSKKKERKSMGTASKGKEPTSSSEKSDTIRVEHLNYKRIAAGMKMLCHIISVQPLALIVSLPNQLLGHVPITQISAQFTALLEAMDEDESNASGAGSDEDNEGSPSKSRVPDLSELFRPGQYLRAVVTTVKPAGTTEGNSFARTRDILEKASRRVELSLVPEQVNAGVSKADLLPGFTLTMAVKSVEDHGYILDAGFSDVSGFLSLKDAQKSSFEDPKNIPVCGLIDVVVKNMSDNGRTCTVSSNVGAFKSATLKEITNVASILPGTLVQALVTAVLPTGLNVQLLGSFMGTVDLYHLPSGDPESNFKVGQKVKARILYDVLGTTPSQFSLSLLDHLIALDVKGRGATKEAKHSLQDSFPIGTILQTVKVIRVETERGIIVEVEPGVEGSVHISHVSDDHVATLSPTSGPWKVNTVHVARVTGYHLLDGLLQLSLRPSVLEKKFLQVGDVHVGEIIKGTIRKLSDTALFVSMSGNVDGVVWPNHYADITLKHPQKRFKAGASIKCRVLAVDSDRGRIVLTAKKTLVESDLPVISKIDDAKVGLIVHAVVSRIFDKSLLVDFYSKLKAIIPAREARWPSHRCTLLIAGKLNLIYDSENLTGKLSESFTIGKPVKVRILSIDSESSRIIASVRQAASNFKPINEDISSVEVGHSVSGVISDIHKDNVVLTLQPTQIRALISLHNIANHRGVSVTDLQTSLKVDDKLDELIVVSRNPDKGFVIVANRPNTKGHTSHSKQTPMDTLRIGEAVTGRVVHHDRHGASIKISGGISGSLYPTDTCDDYNAGMSLPSVGSVIQAVITAIDKGKRHLTLSTRASRITPDKSLPVVDREITGVQDLNTGETVRGFIKNIADNGVFVTLGRGIDARVQIKELYDKYIKDWKKGFEINQLVKGRIVSVNLDTKQVEMSFRSSNVSRLPKPSLSLDELSEGQKVEGRVKRIEDFGIFIEIAESKLTGLCHKSEVADNKDADVILAMRNFREGDKVKAIILGINSEKRRISLGLKPSYFEKEDFNPSESDDEDNFHSQSFDLVQEESNGKSNTNQLNELTMRVDEADASDDDEVMETDPSALSAFQSWDAQSPGNHRAAPIVPIAPTIKLQGGFQWSSKDYQSDSDNNSLSQSDEDSEGEQTKRKRRRKKEIEQDLTADMQTKVPESTADFERHLLGSPNSSYLWIQYMSFQLQLSEVDKAREVGKRGLQTISIREEQEKLNVWIALLNLENTYGTNESLEAVFKDAARHHDSKTIHLRLATIFDQSGRREKAEEQYKRTSKKFGQSSKVWTLFGEHYLRRGDVEKARSLLPRSIQSLDKRKHLKTISKFAQMEYKLGDPERGKTIFEGIVDSHPKRWDLWSVYMDMEASQNNIQNLRNLFDRVLALKMTSHKAKAFFKKWLELERRIGDEEGAGVVKEKAIEWTRRAADST